MRARTMLLTLAIALFTSPAAAQSVTRFSVEPFVGYGFFGDLPEENGSLEADLAYGARVAYQLAEQWAVFGAGQRSTPAVEGGVGGGLEVDEGEATVDHWSVGVEFSYVPRGGAEGMLPILLEAGLGQARYRGGPSDFAANIGIASALQLGRNVAVRYGVNDYVSNYRDGEGLVNQVFVRVGAELSF